VRKLGAFIHADRCAVGLSDDGRQAIRFWQLTEIDGMIEQIVGVQISRPLIPRRSGCCGSFSTGSTYI
jgi:hypothetical protein